MKPPAEELDRRRPVWEAMSAFFLDTELDDADCQGIAAVLRASKYSVEELDEVLRCELAPVLSMNLISPAGEWQGFNMDYVEAQILTRPAGPLRRWWSHVNGGSIAHRPWRRVRQILLSQHST